MSDIDTIEPGPPRTITAVTNPTLDTPADHLIDPTFIDACAIHQGVIETISFITEIAEQTQRRKQIANHTIRVEAERIGATNIADPEAAMNERNAAYANYLAAPTPDSYNKARDLDAAYLDARIECDNADAAHTNAAVTLEALNALATTAAMTVNVEAIRLGITRSDPTTGLEACKTAALNRYAYNQATP